MTRYTPPDPLKQSHRSQWVGKARLRIPGMGGASQPGPNPDQIRGRRQKRLDKKARRQRLGEEK